MNMFNLPSHFSFSPLLLCLSIKGKDQTGPLDWANAAHRINQGLLDQRALIEALQKDRPQVHTCLNIHLYGFLLVALVGYLQDVLPTLLF